MQPTILRQWVMLAMLPHPPRRIDTATIERQLRDLGYEIHRRTIQRDLVQLSSVLPIVSDQREKPFGWRWAENARTLFSSAGEPASARATLRIRLRGAEAPRVVEALGGRDVAFDRDVVTCTADDGPCARRMLLAFADCVEVLAPTSLRADLAERVREASRVYGR